MRFKNISKLLIFGLLFNNTGINSSVVGELSDDTRYETFTGNDITVDNILEEDEVDVEIEGNTLVNLLDITNITSSQGVYIDNIDLTSHSFEVKYNEKIANTPDTRAIVTQK